jgi:hypothetical protein
MIEAALVALFCDPPDCRDASNWLTAEVLLVVLVEVLVVESEDAEPW